MEIFGFKLKAYGCFDLKYLTLLMMLLPYSWTQDNIPSFNVTCNSTGLYVKIAFSKPFSGIAFAKGYRFDPLCSMTESSALNGSLTLPLSACGNYVQESDRYITNTVVIQQHPWIRTPNDFEKLLICHLQSLESFGDSLPSLDQLYESHSLPLIEPSSDIELALKAFQEVSPENTHTHLTIFQLLNRNIYNDFGIKSCIAHDEKILDGNFSHSVYQISNPEEGCFSVNSEVSSSLTFMETNEGLMAYTNLDNLGMGLSDNFYLTCDIVFCETKCRCSEIQQTEYPVSVVSHKLTKRSINPSTEMFSLKQYDARTRFLKSTVKALMDSMIEQRQQNDKKSKIRKRLMRLDDSSFLSEGNSLGSGLESTETLTVEPVSTEMSNNGHSLVDLDYGSDDENSHRNDYDFDPEDSHDNYDYIHEDFHHDYYDPEIEDSHDNKEELSRATKFTTTSSDMIDETVTTEFQNNSTEIVPDMELQGKGTGVSSDDLMSPVNEATENTNIATTTVSFTSIVDIGGHTESCVPRLRFIIVIIVMGFFIGCLLLASCGMALYIRKEKKRNRLNDFLLYSIGF